jgi:hypothetical protein
MADLSLVTVADRKNSGILVDVLHFDRSASTIEQLDAVPPPRLPFVHLCDESQAFQAPFERVSIISSTQS